MDITRSLHCGYTKHTELSFLLFPLLESVSTSKVYRFITNCSVWDTKYKQASQCKPNSSNLQLHFILLT